MLQFVLGIAGTGRTSYLVKQMHERALQQKNSIFLVPEQFSSSAENLIFKNLGDKLSSYVEIVSFRTLAERILKHSGGISVSVLTDAARTAFVRHALDKLGSESLSIFLKQRRDTAFCASCSDTINELKTAGVTPEKLAQVADKYDENKLRELAAVYAAYEYSIEGVALDPSDRLTMAAQNMDGYYLNNKMVFIDDFDGFTAPEYVLLQEVLRYCEKMLVSFCCDTLQEKDHHMGIFSPVRSTAHHLIRLAQTIDVPVEREVYLQNTRRTQKEGLHTINLLLAGETLPHHISSEGVYLTKAENEWEEVRLCAAKMHALAVSGVPYSHMALICRDMDMYKRAVKRAFNTYEIPYFDDETKTIEYTAPVTFLKSALQILKKGFDSQTILLFIKTNLCGYKPEDIVALENYIFTWQPKHSQWKKPFDQNPQGFLSHMNDEDMLQLERAEYVRADVIEKLDLFIQQAKKQTADVLSKELYLLTELFHAGKHTELLAEKLEQSKELLSAQEMCKAWDISMDLLDQMSLLCEGEYLSADEYADLFNILVQETDMGHIPQSLECVIFTSADRMRLADCEYSFVVGLSEGVFPSHVGYSGLLTHLDRDLLVQEDIQMPGSFANRTLLEEMFLYRALTSASNALYLSWPAHYGNDIKNLSSAIEPIILSIQPPDLTLDEQDYLATPLAAQTVLGHIYRQNTPETASIYKALQEIYTTSQKSTLSTMDEMAKGKSFTITKTDTLRSVVGSKIRLSATQTERFYDCKFAYFMQWVLGIRAPRRAQISPLESGTFVHYILQTIMQKTQNNFENLTNEEIQHFVHKYADKFILEKLPLLSLREKHIMERIKQSVIQLLFYMRDGAKENEFFVDALELGIGLDNGLPPLQVTTEKGNQIEVVGRIDRVDALKIQDKTFLCVVDYKTGDKHLDLKELYCGVNMQLMMYMDALCKNDSKRYENPIPAGVLYLPADPTPKIQSKNSPTIYRMDGLLLDDENVLKKLDKSQSNTFVPVRFKKDGSIYASSTLANTKKINNILQHIEYLLKQMADEVYEGHFDAQPYIKAGNRKACDYCEYKGACLHEEGKNERILDAPKNVFEDITKETT